MRRAALSGALTAAALLASTVLSACSSGQDSSSTSGGTPTSRLTEITGPIPAPTATVPVVTQPVPGATTVPAGSAPTPPPTSASPAEPGPTAPPPAGPTCDAATLFAVLKAATSLPPDAGAQPPACAVPWASMVVGAPGQERLLAVFSEGTTGWRLVGFGNEGVCSGAKVPPAAFDALGCPAWEG